MKLHPSGNYVNDLRLKYDFSRGENPLGASFLVKQKIFGLNDNDIVNYPDNLDNILKSEISNLHNCNTNQLLISNGALGVIHHLLRYCFMRYELSVLSGLTFPPFQILCKQFEIQTKEIPLKKNWHQNITAFESELKKPSRIIFLANPNNPTGILESNESISRLIRVATKSSRSLLIIDEANIEYCGKQFIRNNYIDAIPDNVFIIRTFSKIYGLAGLRVGYGIASSKLITKMMKYHQDFSVSQISQIAAMGAINDQRHLLQSIEIMDSGRQELTNGLEKYHFRVIPSQSNYILCKIPDKFYPARSFLKKLEMKSINILNGERYLGLGSRYVRITPGTKIENEFLLRTIEDFSA